MQQNSFPSFAPNGSSLPYAVRFTGWRFWLRVAGYCGGLLLLAMGAFALLSDPDAQNVPLLASFWIAGILFCLFQLWRLRSPLAVFYSDRVEKPGLFRTSILYRTNVKGVGKVVQTRYGSYFEIASASPVEPSIHLNGSLRKDPVIAEWLQGATDPEAEALKEDRARILADARYGATESGRARRLDRTKQWTTAFNVACLALGAWLGFFGALNPTSLLLAVAPLLVAVAIVATCDGLVIWFGRGTAHPRVIGAVAPAAGLAARAGFTVHMLDVQPLIWLALIVGLASAALLYARLVTSASRLQAAISSGVFSGLAAYGLAVALNVCLDGAPGRTFTAFVTGEHVSHGRSTSYYLDLTPWSDRPPSEVSVSFSLYDSAPVGSRVCITRRAGALGLPWFDVALCPASRGPPAEAGETAPRPGVTNPYWVAKPTGQDLADLYPERAQRLGRSGAATIQCVVLTNGSLSECQVVQEQPPGFGFGAASIMAASRFRMRPQTVQGRPVGGAKVTIPMRWRLQ